MSNSRRVEWICGLVSALLGFLALGIQFFAPVVSYVESSSSGATVRGMTSYAQASGGVLFPLVLFGLPLAGVGLGATLHAVSAFAAARVLLWVSTLLLAILVALALLSIGPGLLPSVILAVVASALAFGGRRSSTGGANGPRF